MKDEFLFLPERRTGYLFHSSAIVVLALITALGLWQAAQAAAGPIFLVMMLIALIAMGIIPWLVYCVYALSRAFYSLEREGVRLHWGLRVEEIPMDVVQWVHSSADLEVSLPLPRMRWPGAVVGVRQFASGEEIEFMACRSDDLIFIGTPERIYAISPSDSQAFLRAYQRITEFGSLAPLATRSVYPNIVIRQTLNDRLARGLILAGALLNLVVLVWVSLSIPYRSQLTLGFSNSESDRVPAVRLLLLPFLNIVFFLVDLIIGLAFFRRDKRRIYSYLLWGSGALTSLLFLIGIFFILRNSG